MIDLTPLDVRKKKEDFKRAVRGYDSLQVDSFLDVVADRMEQLVRQHGSLADRVENLEGQLKTFQERERALNDALLAAQELREEARSQAERDAAVRLREAETHAEAILLDADQAIRHSQRRLDDLRLRRGQFLKSLRTILERFEDYLELEQTRVEAESDDMGDLLERLQTDLGEPEPRDVAPAPTEAAPVPTEVAPVPTEVAPVPTEAAAAEPEPAGGPEALAEASEGPVETEDEADPATGSRNGDTPQDDAATEAVAEAGDPALEPESRISSTPITPADAGGSGAASS